MAELSCAEIILLAKLDGKCLNGLSVPGYFSYDYHLNIEASINAMLASGLLTYADFRTSLDNMGVKQLKDILLQCGLPTAGKKSALVDRIVANCDPAVWQNRIDRFLSLTPEGRDLVLKNDVLIYCQNHIGLFSILPDEAGAMSSMHPEWSMYEIVRFILENRGAKFLDSLDYGLYRNTLYGISQTYRHEGIVEREKTYLLQCCFMDAVGYGNGNRIEARLAMLAPALMAELSAIQRQGQLLLDSDYWEALKILPIRRLPKWEQDAFVEIKQHLGE